jgi:hypothetical protein
VKRKSNLMPLSHGYFILSILSCLLVSSVVVMNAEIAQEVEAEIQYNDDITEFPNFNVSSINCNSLNMATVSKNVRMRKFYGILSLKTDIIFVSDIRLCNRSGVGDFGFANKIFATNPYGSYSFIHNSHTNSQGVSILVKKSLNFYVFRRSARRRQQLPSGQSSHQRTNGNIRLYLRSEQE